ncbi:MAG: serine--tRNA ligase [Bdellovibrionota bacterium]
MIDIKLLEKSDSNYLAEYKASLKNRKGDPALVDQLLSLNQERKKMIAQAETQKANQNKQSQEIAKLKKEGKDASAQLESLKSLSDEIKKLYAEAEAADQKVQELCSILPNKAHKDVPVGQAETDNKIVRKWGEPKVFSFKAKEHFEIGEKLGILDFERATKVAGARFTILNGAAARLERALINFMLDIQTKEHHYQETNPPFMANSASFFGTGQFPKFTEDVFHVQGTDYHLIPTAEVPVTNYYRDEILDEAKLPIYLTAYTPCFRSEAGSYGKDTKGLIRQHQFNKVELVKITHPDRSYEEHEKMVLNAEEILKRLELPYRVSLLCTGDMGFGSSKTYDLEVWLPGQNSYREISSCSNCEDFQARRANIRFKSGTNKPQFAHTLNGSGLAVGRTLVAILENYQREDGSVEIPRALQPYTEFKEIR